MSPHPYDDAPDQTNMSESNAPEQAGTLSSQSLPSASLPRRVAAMIYDLLILSGLWLAVTIMLVIANAGQAVPAIILQPALLFATCSFYTIFWRRSGQTLGMLSWQIRVQSLEGGRISLGQCVLRLLFAVPSFGLAGLGLFWMLVDPERRAWHDYASRSRVVALPKKKGWI